MAITIVERKPHNLVMMWKAARAAAENGKEVAFISVGKRKKLDKSEIKENVVIQELEKSDRIGELIDEMRKGVFSFEESYVQQVGRQLSEDEIHRINYELELKKIPARVWAGLDLEPGVSVDRHFVGLTHSHPVAPKPEPLGLNAADKKWNRRSYEVRNEHVEDIDDAHFFSDIIDAAPNPEPLLLFFTLDVLPEIESAESGGLGGRDFVKLLFEYGRRCSDLEDLLEEVDANLGKKIKFFDALDAVAQLSCPSVEALAKYAIISKSRREDLEKK